MILIGNVLIVKRRFSGGGKKKIRKEDAILKYKITKGGLVKMFSLV